ncbi:MAG: hypothetical protein P1U68_16045 [Verrucomicrobiales bacterium]|nr:hypothetical protein [Verrucomicrobiales bacterium]
MIFTKRLLFSVICFSCYFAFSFEPPAKSKILIDEDFSENALPEKWSVQTGAWSAANGVFNGAEIEADHHAAAARRAVVTGDAVYQFNFKIGENTKAFQFGFDPIRGALDKKGHLFSVIVSPSEWKIIKHLDKNKPKEDPNEILATARHDFKPGDWYHLRVTTSGAEVKAEIEGVEPLTAEHPTFTVKKPALVFRVSGSDVQIDELQVWAKKE